jgi:hypothetical protein
MPHFISAFPPNRRSHDLCSRRRCRVACAGEYTSLESLRRSNQHVQGLIKHYKPQMIERIKLYAELQLSHSVSSRLTRISGTNSNLLRARFPLTRQDTMSIAPRACCSRSCSYAQPPCRYMTDVNTVPATVSRPNYWRGPGASPTA